MPAVSTTPTARSFPTSGMYHTEVVGGLGLARWTSSRASLHLPVRGGRIELSLSSARHQIGGPDQHGRLALPWAVEPLEVHCGAWQTVSVRVPRRFRRHAEVDAQLIVDDHWYPSVELGSIDYRCLGVLLRVRDD